MSIDHDRLFKELLTTFFREFMELFFPETIDHIDFTHLKFLESEVFTDVVEGERHKVDILVETRLRGEPGFILIHVEPQSYYETNFNQRMFFYFSRLLQKHRCPILPIAIFAYERKVLREPDSFNISFPFLDVLDFHFYKIELRNLDYRAYLDQPNPVAAALMSKMGFDQSERVRVKLECLRMLVKLELDPARQHLIAGFMSTYLRLNREETKTLEETVRQLGIYEEEEKVMELMTEWEEIGVEKGIEIGVEKGVEIGVEKGIGKGELKLVLFLVQNRFGQIPSDLVEKIKTLSIPELELFANKLFDFRNADDLRLWLDQNL